MTAPSKGGARLIEASKAVIDLSHGKHQALINKKATDKIIWLMAKLAILYSIQISSHTLIIPIQEQLD